MPRGEAGVRRGGKSSFGVNTLTIRISRRWTDRDQSLGENFECAVSMDGEQVYALQGSRCDHPCSMNSNLQKEWDTLRDKKYVLFRGCPDRHGRTRRSRGAGRQWWERAGI